MTTTMRRIPELISEIIGEATICRLSYCPSLSFSCAVLDLEIGLDTVGRVFPGLLQRMTGRLACCEIGGCKRPDVRMRFSLNISARSTKRI